MQILREPRRVFYEHEMNNHQKKPKNSIEGGEEGSQITVLGWKRPSSKEGAYFACR